MTYGGAQLKCSSTIISTILICLTTVLVPEIAVVKSKPTSPSELKSLEFLPSPIKPLGDGNIPGNLPNLVRVKRHKIKMYAGGYQGDENGLVVIPYLPETSWSNAAYDKPGVYGAGWGTQYIHPVVIEVQGDTTEANYDPTASNYQNPGNWPKWYISAIQKATNPGQGQSQSQYS